MTLAVRPMPPQQCTYTPPRRVEARIVSTIAA